MYDLDIFLGTRKRVLGGSQKIIPALIELIIQEGNKKN